MFDEIGEMEKEFCYSMFDRLMGLLALMLPKEKDVSEGGREEGRNGSENNMWLEYAGRWSSHFSFSMLKVSACVCLCVGLWLSLCIGVQLYG